MVRRAASSGMLDASASGHIGSTAKLMLSKKPVNTGNKNADEEADAAYQQLNRLIEDLMEDSTHVGPCAALVAKRNERALVNSDDLLAGEIQFSDCVRYFNQAGPAWKTVWILESFDLKDHDLYDLLDPSNPDFNSLALDDLLAFALQMNLEIIMPSSFRFK